MKARSLLVVLLAAIVIASCQAEQSVGPEESAVAETSSEATALIPDSILTDYVRTQEALAADDFGQAKAGLQALVESSSGEIRNLAEQAAEAGDVAAMRHAFKPLSEHLVAMDLPEGYAAAFCSMYEMGAPWVQKGQAIRNPYFGSAMLECGDIIKTGGK